MQVEVKVTNRIIFEIPDNFNMQFIADNLLAAISGSITECVEEHMRDEFVTSDQDISITKVEEMPEVLPLPDISELSYVEQYQ